ncbi:MAG: serine hydrolase, partial [Bdellovibrionales bacterium]|nr:serine hydrolase [Bdellovibrionales bacterium]
MRAEPIFASLNANPYPPKAPSLQQRLDRRLTEMGFGSAIIDNKLGIALVDISNPRKPEFAGVNHYQMQYAASLPKIAILFGLMKQVEAGDIRYNDVLRSLASDMIQYSSNTAATELYLKIGPDYLAKLLMSPHYQFYNRRFGGGLWVGKEYSKEPAWQREPMKNLSHAASPLQVARFYYMLAQDKLFKKEWVQEEMKDLMRGSELDHKFIHGLKKCCPDAIAYRKSGSWSTFHSDSALIENGEKKYIAVALTNDPVGYKWLEDLIVEFDQLV